MSNTNKEPTHTTLQNRKNEAAYWERNIKSSWSTAKPVSIKFAKNLSEMINIRLSPETLRFVRDEAERKGIGPTQLIRMWIKERIASS